MSLLASEHLNKIRAKRAGSIVASAVGVKAFKSFQIFPVPEGESGPSCGVMELEGHQYGAGPDF